MRNSISYCPALSGNALKLDVRNILFEIPVIKIFGCLLYHLLGNH